MSRTLLIPLLMLGQFVFCGCEEIPTNDTQQNNVPRYSDFEIVQVDEDVILVSYKGEDEEVTIPSGVTKIATGALRNNRIGAWSRRYVVKSVVVPGSVKKINTFGHDLYLNSIIISEGTEEIEAGAFRDFSLISVEIPNGVKIGDGAFAGCSNLTIYAPSGSYAEEYAKKNGISFKEGKIPVKSTSNTEEKPDFIIEHKDGEEILVDCDKDGDEYITIPEGVTVIASEAFNRFREYGDSAYWHNCSLKHVKIPDSVKRIEDGAFAVNRNITIHASRGSYAEKYAKENEMKFEAE